jgi:hypothetical protein
MPLIDPTETVRLNLPAAGEWVDLRAHISRGEAIGVRRRIVAGAQIQGSGFAGLDAGDSIEAAEFATLELAIVAWSFGAPVTPAAIRRLDGPSVDAIKAKVDELYAERPAAEKKGSGSSGPTQLSDGAPPRLSLAG